MSKAMLAPAAVLVVWSLIVMTWMAVQRFRAVKALRNSDERAKLRQLPKVGGRGQDLESVLPAHATWASHNYTHLMEQPTLFYATVTILALVGDGRDSSLAFAWAYTGLRILHSLWQGLVNTIPVRGTLFMLSTICLGVLSVRAVVATIG